MSRRDREDESSSSNVVGAGGVGGCMLLSDEMALDCVSLGPEGTGWGFEPV